MPTIKLYNVELGRLDDYEVSTDQNGDIVCEGNGDFVKFPGGLNRGEFDEQIAEYNKANETLVPVETAAPEQTEDANQALLDTL